MQRLWRSQFQIGLWLAAGALDIGVLRLAWRGSPEDESSCTWREDDRVLVLLFGQVVLFVVEPALASTERHRNEASVNSVTAVLSEVGASSI